MVSRCCSVDNPPESQETVDNRFSARIALDGSASLGRWLGLPRPLFVAPGDS